MLTGDFCRRRSKKCEKPRFTVNKKTSQFAICLNNEGYEASLEVGKVYRVIPDQEAAAHEYIRIVDESDEDYTFDADRFYKIEFPPLVEATLDAALH